MKAVHLVVVVLGMGVSPVRAEPDATLEILVRTLSGIEDPETQANVLRGMNASLEGREGITPPPEWNALYEKLEKSSSAEVRRQTLALAATMGGAGALDSLRKTLADPGAAPEARESALGSLLAAKDRRTLPLLLDLVERPGPLRAPALRGLATFEDPELPARVIRLLGDLEAEEKGDALLTLVARPAGALALLAAIDAGTLKKSEISAPLAAQLRNFRDPRIDTWIAVNWGSVRRSSSEKEKEIERHKKFLGTEAILAADVREGHGIFLQRCAACHKLHGEGSLIGPELPGSYQDLDYLLQNILDPNAVIGIDYQQSIVRTKDGQVMSGVITGDGESAVTLRTLAGPATIQRANIESMETLEQSLMPEGLLTGLDEDGIRDLFLYLRQSKPLPAEP
jgi:putative heme-binding domain-containing protein